MTHIPREYRDAVLAHILARVDKNPTDETLAAKGCWAWTGGHSGNGYSVATVHLPHKTTVNVHRAFAEIAQDRDVDRDVVADHTCENKGCVNYAHVEFVSNAVNLLRSKRPDRDTGKCKKGHPREGGNLYRSRRLAANGSIYVQEFCAVCNRENGRRRRQRPA
jgi:hypothetical protein